MTTEPPPIPRDPLAILWSVVGHPSFSWILAGALVVALALALRGCSSERTARKATAANLAALTLAYQNPAKHADTGFARHDQVRCDGTLARRELADGTIEWKCVGKADLTSTATGHASSDETPILPPTLPGVVQPSAVSPRWGLGGGAGIGTDFVTRYGALAEMRLVGPIWVSGIVSFPAPLTAWAYASVKF